MSLGIYGIYVVTLLNAPIYDRHCFVLHLSHHTFFIFLAAT